MSEEVTSAYAIRELRKKYRLSQVELARRLGLAASTVFRWETDKGTTPRMSLEEMKEILEAEMDAAKAVRELRKDLTISRSEFARRMGVSYQTVVRWEEGKVTPRLTVAEMATRLGAPKDPAGITVFGELHIAIRTLVARAAKAGITTEQLQQLLGEPSGEEQTR